MSKIEYVTKSWNPVVGCTFGCSYCWARKILNRFNNDCSLCKTFALHAHPERLAAPLRWKKSQRVFLGSLTDMFASGIDPFRLLQITEVIKATPQHHYIAMTKCRTYPKEFIGIDNLWTGQTIESGEIPCPMEHKILNIEPMLDQIFYTLQIQNYRWVIVGAQTNPYREIPREQVGRVIDSCRKYKIPVFVKNNVGGVWPQEYPEDLKLKGEMK